MFRIIAILITLIFPGIATAGTIDLMWEQSNDYGIRSSTKGVDFADESGVTEIRGSYRYGKTDGIVTQDEGELGIDYNPPLNDRWSICLDERVSYDKVLGIYFENNLGFGVKYYAYKKEEIKFSLSAGVLYQFASWNCGEDATCEQVGTGRYSYRAKFINEKIYMAYYYEPNVSDGSDYISTFISEVEVATVSESMTLIWSYENEYWSLYGQAETSGLKLRLKY